MSLMPADVAKAVSSVRGSLSTLGRTSSNDSSSSDFHSVSSLAKGEQGGVCVILAQVAAVALFLSSIVGAFYYAVRSGEAEYEIEHTVWNATSNYSAFFDQFSSSGKFTITLSQPGAIGEVNIEFESYWYQNDETRHIVHRVDNSTVVYVMPEVTFWVKLNSSLDVVKCTEEKEGGYFNYVDSLGLFSLEDRHSEFERMRNDKSGYIYDSYPPSNPLFHEHGFKKGEALLVQAFVDFRTGILLGWQTYFAMDTVVERSLRRTEYWFPTMRRAAPDEEPFNALPSLCVPS